MPRITKVVTIKEQPAKVLSYITDVKNHPAFLSALKSVTNLKGDPMQVGQSWDWTFVMGGVEIKGRAETAAYTAGKNYSFKTTSGIVSTFSYSLESAPEGTRLTVDVDYEVPNNVLGKIADKAVVERLNDQEGDRAVQNLQAILGS
jgi:carbon monoxide dehydrogenase subunit G